MVPEMRRAYCCTKGRWRGAIASTLPQQTMEVFGSFLEIMLTLFVAQFAKETLKLIA